jgi:formate--tetrahydrofolate ligase
MTQRPINDIAEDLGIDVKHLIPFGFDKAKISLNALNAPRRRTQPPKLILVSAITPTPAGEGKTTTTIGLGQAIRRLGHSVCVALREPSLGPCFGVKGGGAGGGKCQVEPSTQINLHFNGDFHAISAAHNLLAAAIDNHLHHGNKLDIDSGRVLWPRVVDMNDRALRNVIVGLGGRTNGVPRESSFEITAASEVMAMLCLASSIDDLKNRLDRTIVAFNKNRVPITAGDLEVSGAMLALLSDAIHPNLVQTSDGTPAIVHGGPFANIAHGCNSVVATRMAMHCADWTITEAGFGFDLGAEKFFDIKCVEAGLDPAAVVMVATVRALKMHGGVPVKELGSPDPDAVARGLVNLEKHIESVRQFGKEAVVAINQFGTDTSDETAVIYEFCQKIGVRTAISDHFARGGAGAEDLASAVLEVAGQPGAPFTPLYAREDGVIEKIRAVAQKMYGADDIVLTRPAKRDLKLIQRLNLNNLPICIAKTQSSLSDDPRRPGRPTNFKVTVRRIRLNTGAGFLVVLTGDIMRMPGLPRHPQANDISLRDGRIVGVG